MSQASTLPRFLFKGDAEQVPRFRPFVRDQQCSYFCGEVNLYQASTCFFPPGRASPPSEVLIVSLDRESAEVLNLSRKTQKWPRTLHAQLVQTLSRQGAAVIIFDLPFDEAHDADAAKVVLCESIRQEKVPITASRGKYLADLNIETRVPPIAPLALSALALAPFPLPTVPVQRSQFWMFQGKNSRYLDFYGPAGTIHTRLYHKALKGRNRPDNVKGNATETSTGFEGNVLFVGLSENLRPQHQDGYHTVFSIKTVSTSAVWR